MSVNNFFVIYSHLVLKVFLEVLQSKMHSFYLHEKKKFASESSVFDGKQPVEKKERKLFFVRCFFIRV